MVFYHAFLYRSFKTAKFIYRSSIYVVHSICLSTVYLQNISIAAINSYIR